MITKDEFAQKLPNLHYNVETGMMGIYRLQSAEGGETNPNEPIKLLEVNEDTIAAGVMPLHFGAFPSRGLDYPTVIIEITPEEFEQVKANQLKLPNGWQLGPEIPKPTLLIGDD